MPRSRSTSVPLARLLNSAEQPIYVLDDDGTIVFVNRPMRDWLGPDLADRLLGQRCRYQSGSAAAAPHDHVAATAAGLCPPPSATGGEPSEVVVHVPMSDGRIERRVVRVLPIGPADEDAIGSMIIVGDVAAEDEVSRAGGVQDAAGADRDAAVELPESARLHGMLWELRRQAAIRFGGDRLVGHSARMQLVRRQVELAVASDASVLLVGPSGSGRQHTASVIHYRGNPQGVGPLVPLACDVLGPDLIVSTIAAIAARESADMEATADGEREDVNTAPRGSLLLRDVDHVPAEAQRDVAEAISKPSFPLRLLATAREPLDELVRRNRFRPELAAVLGTLVIHLPPLVERRDDIPLLAQLFLEDCNAQGERQLDGFTAEAMDQLVAHDWPGNLDELAETVAQAHRETDGRQVTVDDLPARLVAHRQADARPPRERETIDLDAFLRRIERELIERAMTEAGGNKAQAARLLGLTRPRLYRRLKELGIDEGP